MIYGLILSAGYSSRLLKFKPLAKYKGKFFILNIIQKLSQFCEKIFIVTGYQNKLLRTEIRKALPEFYQNKKIDLIYNKDFKKGMFSSVQVAAQELYKLLSPKDLIFLHLVDQPHIKLETYRKMCNVTLKSEDEIIVPSYKFKKGHPLIIKFRVLKKIIKADKTIILRDIVNKSNIHYVEVDDAAVLGDIDTDEELKNLTNKTEKG